MNDLSSKIVSFGLLHVKHDKQEDTAQSPGIDESHDPDLVSLSLP